MLLGLLVQLLYLSYKFGQIEQKLIDQDKRTGRLERFQDSHSTPSGG